MSRDESREAVPYDPIAEKLIPDVPTEEVVARMVARNPEQHGTPLAVRLARARRLAQEGDFDAWERFEAGRIREAGGDPMEMLPGNKPRYTVEENGDVKDHDSGTVHHAAGGPPIPESVQAAAGDSQPAGDAVRVVGGADSAEVGEPARVAAGRESAHESASEKPAGGRRLEPGISGGTAPEEHAREGDAGGPDVEQGAVHHRPGEAETGGSDGVDSRNGDTAAEGLGEDEPAQRRCKEEEHDFAEPITAETPCAKCGVTFLQWAES